jgi:hypothetical protein
MHTNLKKQVQISIELIANSEGQGLIRSALDQLSGKNQIPYEMQVKSRDFSPDQTLIIVTVIANVASDLIISFFDELWRKIEGSNIKVKSQGFEKASMKAKSYLGSIGINDVKIIKNEDKGLYYRIVYRDSAGFSHVLRISKSDLEIIKYERSED